MLTFKEFIAESIEDKGIFKAIFIVGSPGSGKSYTIKKLMGQVQPVIVNTDKAVEFISNKRDAKISAAEWADYGDTALRITKAQLSNYLNSMLPLFIDGTSNNTSNLLHRIGILESLGYDVGMVHVKTDWETVKANINARNAEINRQVDLDFAETVFSQSAENISFLKNKVSFFREFNNTHGVMDNAELDDIFKHVQKFFSAPLLNPVGKRNVQALRDAKQKYLTPEIITDAMLNNKTQGWYRE